MGFKEVRGVVIKALEEGWFSHEERDLIEEKNLLFTGEVSPAEVASLLKTCRGHQHQRSLHHADRTLTVHIFKPVDSTGAWYIKCHLTDVDGNLVVFISVHQ